MNPRRFRAVILTGHKEVAVEVPFDPATLWGAAPVRIRVGRQGFPVRAVVGGNAFASFIVRRSRHFFLLLGTELLSTVGAAPGDTIVVSVSSVGSVSSGTGRGLRNMSGQRAPKRVRQASSLRAPSRIRRRNPGV